MPQTSPERETIRAALSIANRAPSIHNSQPWLWRVGPHSVHLYVDRSLRLEHADPDSRNLIVSFGAALNHCAIALAAAIPRRRTDRRHFSSWPVSLGDVALMGARAARYGVTMRRVEVSTTFKAVLAQSVWLHAKVVHSSYDGPWPPSSFDTNTAAWVRRSMPSFASNRDT